MRNPLSDDNVTEKTTGVPVVILFHDVMSLCVPVDNTSYIQPGPDCSGGSLKISSCVHGILYIQV